MYRQARNLYWRLVKPSLYRRLLEDRARVRSFIRPRALVFDIGANVGDMSALYLDLGARVIAVEPIPMLASLIRRRFNVPVEEVALGAKAGQLTLHLGRIPNHSTLSPAYAKRFSDRLSGQTMTVPVMTLDDLIAKYGEPEFVKIDVEGYEPEVLRGLSRRLRVVAFEFQFDLMDHAAECLALLTELGDYRFQFTENFKNGSTPLLPDEPTGSQELVERIRGALTPASYGDIYAMRQS